jgi:hypothetical protein
MYKVTNSFDRHIAFADDLYAAYEVAAVWTGESHADVVESTVKAEDGSILGGDDPLASEDEWGFGGIAFTIAPTDAIVTDMTTTIGGVAYDVCIASDGEIVIKHDDRYVGLARLVREGDKVKVSIEEASFTGEDVDEEAALEAAVLAHLRDTIGEALIATNGDDWESSLEAIVFFRQLAQTLGIDWTFRSWSETGLALRGGRLGGVSFE